MFKKMQSHRERVQNLARWVKILELELNKLNKLNIPKADGVYQSLVKKTLLKGISISPAPNRLILHDSPCP